MDHIITKGPFKGKTVTFANTKLVVAYQNEANDFMYQIFDMEPGHYLISDESSVTDFEGVNSLKSIHAINKRIQEVYGIAPCSIVLVELFKQIRKAQPNTKR